MEKTKNAKAAMLAMAIIATEETNKQATEETYKITRDYNTSDINAYVSSDYKPTGSRSPQLSKKQKKSRAKSIAAKKARKQRRK